jgi:hypothetical protein
MKRALAVLIASLVVSVLPGCGDGSQTSPLLTSGPTAPSQGSASPRPQQIGPITFGGLTGEGTAVTSYTESDVTVLVTAGGWKVGANYGNPRPFIRFQAQGGTTVTGEIRVTAGGAAFSFKSVDLYSSTTPIPYAITGRRNSATVFVATGTLPNTFGQFRTVPSPDAAAFIDTLTIALTNAAAPCCTNPMGIDNIALAK